MHFVVIVAVNMLGKLVDSGWFRRMMKLTLRLVLLMLVTIWRLLTPYLPIDPLIDVLTMSIDYDLNCWSVVVVVGVAFLTDLSSIHLNCIIIVFSKKELDFH